MWFQVHSAVLYSRFENIEYIIDAGRSICIKRGVRDLCGLSAVLSCKVLNLQWASCRLWLMISVTYISTVELRRQGSQVRIDRAAIKTHEVRPKGEGRRPESILSGAPLNERRILITWFTPCSGHMVNTLSGMNGEGPGSTRSLSLLK